MKNSELLFNSFNKDKDGKITPLQLQNCLSMIGGGLSVEEAETVAKGLVSNENGLVGLGEFVDLADSTSEEEKMEDMKKAFGMYKMEGDECITPRSLKWMLGRFGEWSLDDCEVMIGQFDLDGDGVLSFQEFEVMMHN